MAPNLTELKAASRGKNLTGRNRRVRGLEWKRLSHPSGPPGTTLGGTVLNYVTIFQPQEFFTEAVLLSARERDSRHSKGERKGLTSAVATALAARGEEHCVCDSELGLQKVSPGITEKCWK